MTREPSHSDTDPRLTAMALMRDGRYAEAAAVLDGLPPDRQVADLLGECLIRAGHPEGAVAGLEAAARSWPADPAIALRLLRALFAAGAPLDGQLATAADFALNALPQRDLRRFPGPARLVATVQAPLDESLRLPGIAATMGALFGTMPPTAAGALPLPLQVDRDSQAPAHRLADVTLVPPHWFAIAGDGTLHGDPLLVAPQHLFSCRPRLARSPHALARDGDRILMRLPAREVAIEETCILLGGSSEGSAFHTWFVEHLPRLAVLDAIGFTAALPVLIAAEPPEWLTASLQYLGIGPERWRFCPQDAVARCRELVVPTLPVAYDRMYPGAMDWLRRGLAPDAGAPRRGRRILVSRCNPGRRRFLNEAQAANRLRALGFETVVVDAIPLARQIESFREAEAIVGPMGTCLLALLFAPADCRIIELAVPQAVRTSRHNQNYAGLIGQPFAVFPAMPVRAETAETTHSIDFTVNVHALAEAVAEMLAA